MKKMPPIEKVYEAWSAIADGRVDIHTDALASVVSSDREKKYTIVYDLGQKTYASDDNSTFWQGYPGYPVLAVMMLRGQLPLDAAWADKWKDINWNQLNKDYKRDYAAAVAHIEQTRGIDPATGREKAQAVMDALQKADITVKRLSPSFISANDPGEMP